MKLFVTISLVAAFLLINGCSKIEKPKEVKEEETPVTPMTETVQQRILSFNLEGLTDKGTKKWEVKGESAEAISESEIKLDNIVAASYGEEALATITADKGIYDKLKNNVRLKENVKATIENTEEVLGAPKTKEDEPTDKKKTRTIITCDGEVEFDYEKNLAYFDKDVKVVSDDGDIYADRITINLEPDTKKVKDIIAEGNVRIIRGENTTYSEKATYIADEKKVILTGKPKLVIYQEGDTEAKFFGK